MTKINKNFDAITYSYAREQLAKTMERVCKDHSPVIITRQKSEPVVLVSLSDYSAIQETSYLISNPYNAKRLGESIEQLKKKKILKKNLL